MLWDASRNLQGKCESILALMHLSQLEFMAAAIQYLQLQLEGEYFKMNVCGFFSYLRKMV